LQSTHGKGALNLEANLRARFRSREEGKPFVQPIEPDFRTGSIIPLTQNLRFWAMWTFREPASEASTWRDIVFGGKDNFYFK
jgi:hypothetical protein